MAKAKRVLSGVTLLSLGFLLIILVGSCLLMLPWASVDGHTSWLDALFTATSATCVTGLTTVSTGAHWTMFGQIVILVLIQIGGLGFMTVITIMMMILRKPIGLYNRTVLMQSAGSYNLSGVTKLIKRIIIGTFIFESIGAIILSFCFYPQYGKMGIYYGIFHSISAFCNAGFDVLNTSTAGGSFVDYHGNWLVLSTIMSLIYLGGLGFIVWSDIIDKKFKFKNFFMHTKIVLVFNTLLFILPAFLFYLFEFSDFGKAASYSGYTISEQILNSLFLSVTPRTAGFNTVDLSNLSSSGRLLTIILMFIGGNSGSTAGGVKLTTIVVVIANLISSASGNKQVVMFKRKISSQVIKQASSLVLAYLILVLISTIAICTVESLPMEEVLFEVVSALGTVGLSLGLSGSSSAFTKIILIFLMYAGRLGALTLFNLFFRSRKQMALLKPEGKILVG